MNIREASAADIDNLCLLFNDYRIFYNKAGDINGARLFLSERMANKEAEIFVAENTNQELTGFVQLYPIFSSTRMQRMWLLNDLFVRPEYRGQGVSKLLIDRCKELCHDTGSCGLILETAKDNAVGNNLYHRTGFILDSAHNFYEWNPAVKPV